MKNISILTITLLTSILSLLLTSCSTVELKPEAAHVVYVAEPSQVRNCQYLGELIGTEGHWYNSLYISNKDLMQAALNDLLNQAAEKGADTIYMKEPYTFATSVTVLGLTYRCHSKP